MAEFRMPSLGATMETGTLVEWLKQPGDAVKRGDIIAVVDTEKGAIEIEVFEDGVLRELRVAPGQQVPVGTVLAVIAAPGDPAVSSVAPPQPIPPKQPAGREGGPAQVRSSPAARAAASKRGVDLAAVRGTGPDGAITLADVERASAFAVVQPPRRDKAAGRPGEAAPVPPSAAAVATPEAADRMRQAIAATMARSKRDIPHFYLGTTIDLGRALDWLNAQNAGRPVTERMLPAVLLIKAVALALREVPELNGFWIDGAFHPGERIHPGVAVFLRGGGLVAPALRDADTHDLPSLMSALRDLVARARTGGLRSSEVSGQTITITNLGEQGVELGYGIIYPPQVALVTFGRIVEEPRALGGQVQIRPVTRASVSVDHRAVDGHRAGVFLAALDRHLQSPETL
jgi:pyruvate dehydrogenase E2 component (dihydrolipoamide acetyltransferase)